MDIKKRKKKLTVMLVPHNGRQIKSIELTSIFLVSSLIACVGLIAVTFYFVYQYVNTKSLLERNTAYIEQKEETLQQISRELQTTSDLSERFSAELEKTKSLFQNTSFEGIRDDAELRIGDFEQALDLVIQEYSENENVVQLASLADQLKNNLPLLENMNQFMNTQKELFTELPVYWPVKGARVSMEWGPNIHPVTGQWYVHKGFDFAALTGTPVQAAAQGEVTLVGYDVGYGLHVYVNHQYGFKTHYSHLSSIIVKKGQRIQQGQVVGKVGNTGLTTGSHLHYELYLGNELVDPGVYFRVFNDYERPTNNR